MSKPRHTVVPPLAYRPLTPLYDIVNNYLGFGRPFLRRVIAAADLKAGERMLDLGCGTGTLLAEVRLGGADIDLVGLEPDGGALSIARAKVGAANRTVPLVQGLGEDLPFASGSLDVVTSTMVFHHLPTETKRQTVSEVHRVLKDGGRFLLVDFGQASGAVRSAILFVGSLFDGRERMRANLRGELPYLLRECGYAVAEVAPPYRGLRFLRGVKGAPTT